MSQQPDPIREFILASHFQLDKVKAMLDENPALLRAAYQWGENDFEDGLGAAAHVGNRAITEFFLSQGVPSTICVAAMLGRLDEVKAYLDQDPALVNARGTHGISLMFHAAMSGKLDLVDLLYARGCTEGYDAALHGAINFGHTEMVAWLLDHGATRLDVPNFQGKTPLERAEEEGLSEIADLLRARGATV